MTVDLMRSILAALEKAASALRMVGEVVPAAGQMAGRVVNDLQNHVDAATGLLEEIEKDQSANAQKAADAESSARARGASGGLASASSGGSSSSSSGTGGSDDKKK
jgi:hypothetical protein